MNRTHDVQTNRINTSSSLFILPHKDLTNKVHESDRRGRGFSSLRNDLDQVKTPSQTEAMTEHRIQTNIIIHEFTVHVF